MPLAVNTNTAAMQASFNLGRANESLRKSLGRLSSGKRINSSGDDAGGMSVAYKLASKANRTNATIQNMQNGISCLEVQDGMLESIGKNLDRLAELRTMAQDATKNTDDIANYTKEFIELQRQLQQSKNTTFNGMSLFANSAALASGNPAFSKGTTVSDEGVQVTIFSRTLFTNPSGQASGGSISLGVINLQNILRLDGGLDVRYAPGFNAGANIPSGPQIEWDDFALMTNCGFGGSTSVTGTTLQAFAGIYSVNSAGATVPMAAPVGGGPLEEIAFDQNGVSIWDKNALGAGAGYYRLSVPDKLPNIGNLNGSNSTNFGSTGVYSDCFTSDGFHNNIMFVSVGQFTTAIERLADARAENGAQRNHILQVVDRLQFVLINLDAAHGRIMNSDIASESTNFARQNILVQGGAAMAAQANQLTNIALTLHA